MPGSFENVSLGQTTMGLTGLSPSTTYNIFAEVTEMFVHDGASTEPIPVEVRANTTVDYVAWTYFRSDEQTSELALLLICLISIFL